MKTFTIAAAVALLASFVSAAPAPTDSSSDCKNLVTFIGPTYNDSFSQEFPTDGTGVQVSNSLNVSQIINIGTVPCTFYGIDGSYTMLIGGAGADVGPPQTQIYGYCHD